MDERKVVVPDSELELPHGFDKRRALDVADGASELFRVIVLGVREGGALVRSFVRSRRKVEADDNEFSRIQFVRWGNSVRGLHIEREFEFQGTRTEKTQTHLNDTNIRHLARLVHGNLAHALDPVLDRVRDVGHDLHGLPEVVAFALCVSSISIYPLGQV